MFQPIEIRESVNGGIQMLGLDDLAGKQHYVSSGDIHNIVITICIAGVALAVILMIRYISKLDYANDEARSLRHHEEVMKYGRPEDHHCETCGRPWEVSR